MGAKARYPDRFFPVLSYKRSMSFNIAACMIHINKHLITND